MSPKVPKLDTTLEAAGAEHLVVGRLLINGYQAFRAQANQPGYDILVVDSELGRSLKIQVKSRIASDSGGHPVNHADFDFLVCVRLNLGTKIELSRRERSNNFNAIFYVIPITDIEQKIPGKLARSVVMQDRYKDNWDQISITLRGDQSRFSVSPDDLRPLYG